jgi:hypothetical protein
MALLNDADNIMAGATQVQRVYRGTTLVWEYEKPTSTSLSASSTSINAGTAITLTASVSGGVPASSSVRFRSGSLSGTIVGTDTASPWAISVTPPVGATTYYAQYLGSGAFLPSNSGGVTVTCYQPTTLSLSASASTINNGESVTLTATISGASTGSVQFRTGSTSGTVVATVSASGGQASTVQRPTSDTTYYATYVANGYNKASSSGSRSVVVRQLITKSWQGKAGWCASYDSSGSKRGTDPLYFGYVSSTWGNQRSLCGGFDFPADLKNAVDVFDVEVDIKTEHTYLNSGGKITLGIHNYVNEPSSWSSSRVTDGIKNSTVPKAGDAIIGLGSSFWQGWVDGTAHGMAFGPGPSNSTDYYGYIVGGTRSARPQLRISYKVWE